MGRPRKPTAVLKANGTWRADRHDGRADDAIAGSGLPASPAWLDAEAAAAWDAICAALPPGVLCAVDSMMLAGCCRWWSTWRACDVRLASGEGDAVKLAQEAALAWRQFEHAAAKLGLSPTDRAKLNIPAAPMVSAFTPATEGMAARRVRSA